MSHPPSSRRPSSSRAPPERGRASTCTAGTMHGHRSSFHQGRAFYTRGAPNGCHCSRLSSFPGHSSSLVFLPKTLLRLRQHLRAGRLTAAVQLGEEPQSQHDERCLNKNEPAARVQGRPDPGNWRGVIICACNRPVGVHVDPNDSIHSI